MPNQTIKYFANILNSSTRLNLKEKDILTKRLKGNNLERIAKRFKISDERIRQIEENSINKLSKKTFQEKLF